MSKLCFADSQYWLDGVTSLGIGNRSIDVSKVIELHEAVKGKFPRLIKFDQFRDELLGHSIALNDAEGFPPSWQRLPVLTS